MEQSTDAAADSFYYTESSLPINNSVSQPHKI